MTFQFSFVLKNKFRCLTFSFAKFKRVNSVVGVMLMQQKVRVLKMLLEFSIMSYVYKIGYVAFLNTRNMCRVM